MRLKMMGGGDSVDYDSLTATAADVPEGLSFIGSGSDEEQTGTLPNMENAHGAPGRASDPTVPIHTAVSVRTERDTYGNARIILAPPKGKYPGSERSFVGCYPIDLGLSAEKIANGHTIAGVTGSYGSDSTVAAKDIRNGKIAYGTGGRIVGSAADYGKIVRTIGAGESVTLSEGFYGESKVTAKDLASQTAGSLDAARMVSGQNGYANGKKVSGSMADRGAYQWAGRGGHGDSGFGSGTENGVEYYAFNNAPDGWYHNQGDRWSPELRLEKSAVRSALGVDASKILKNQCIADVWGSAPIITDYNWRMVDNTGFLYPNTKDWDFNHLDTGHGNWFMCNVPTSTGYVIIRVSCGNTDAAATMAQNAWCAIGTNTWRMVTLRPYASSDTADGSYNTTTVRLMFYRTSNGDLYYHPLRGSTYGTFTTSIVVLGATTVDLSKWS